MRTHPYDRYLSPISERFEELFVAHFDAPNGVEYEYDGLRSWDRVTRVPAQPARDYVVSLPGDTDQDEPQTYTCVCAADAAQEFVRYWIGCDGEHVVLVDGVKHIVTFEQGCALVEVAS